MLVNSKYRKELDEMIKEELNVKEVVHVSDPTELCDIKFKPNFKTLGKKCGPKMKDVAKAVSAGGADIEALASKKIERLVIGGVELEPEDIIVEFVPKASLGDGWAVTAENGIIVALDTRLTPELIEEGLAREFVSKVQDIRKKMELNIIDHIAIEAEADDEVANAVRKHLAYVSEETLASSVDFMPLPDRGNAVKLNDFDVKINVSAVNS